MIFSVFAAALETKIIVAVAAGGAALIGVIVLLVLFKFKKRSEKARIGVEDGVRYTGNAAEYTPSGEVNVTHAKGDVVLVVGKTYKAQKNGYIMPGKYTVLAASEGGGTFNIRLGLFVREYRHGDSVVIGEGEEITAVSGTVILR